MPVASVASVSTDAVSDDNDHRVQDTIAADANPMCTNVANAITTITRTTIAVASTDITLTDVVDATSDRRPYQLPPLPTYS